MKKLAYWTALLGCLFSFPQVAHAYPLTIKHEQGETVIKEQPKRIAVFDLASLDTLQALDVQATAVPKAIWPQYLSQYEDEKFTKVGSLFKPDFEALKKVQPDLIIVAGRSKAAYGDLSKIAPTIDVTINPTHFLDGVEHNITLFGKIFDRADQAQQLISQLDQSVSSLQALGKQQGSGLVLFTMKGNLMVHAPGERFGMLYELTGLNSVAQAAEAPASKSRPKPGSPEAKAMQEQRQQRLDQAIANKPNWLIVLDRDEATGGEGEAEKTISEKLGNTEAYQAGHVYYLNPTEWYIVTGGYQSIMNTVNDLTKQFQK
ncbi:siderophore ABC transporter substrate-binding protein [Vibrio gangliei]|uniref:siderophore ABC transporter substrate-binding protein n=1 Tax=Vibrio gangliei TaxID=2077090 RepID=UPI000D016D11|nr:siderophore ABC transporter substrate-binding protein [Vibrio gangliei]